MVTATNASEARFIVYSSSALAWPLLDERDENSFYGGPSKSPDLSRMGPERPQRRSEHAFLFLQKSPRRIPMRHWPPDAARCTRECYSRAPSPSSYVCSDLCHRPP